MKSENLIVILFMSQFLAGTALMVALLIYLRWVNREYRKGKDKEP
jgi:hypothetical protein